MPGRKSFLVRLPEELLDALNRWAKDDLRSVNAQIEYLLREAVLARRGPLKSRPHPVEGDDVEPA